MKLTATRGRRIAAGIGLACAAALLPITALAASGSAGAPARPSTVSDAAHRASPATPACRYAGTTVWTGSPGNGTAGTIFFDLEFSNTGHATCTLFGYPGVSAVNGSGHIVGVPATHSGPRSLVTIRVGGTAHVILAVHEAGAICAHPVSGSELRVYAPGQFGFHLTPFSVEVCPHTPTMNVDAVHPNAGIPFYSIR